MKYLFLLASVCLLFACKPGKGDKQAAETGNDTINIIHPPDSATGPEMPAGKTDIESFGDTKLGQPYLETLKALGDPGTKSKAEEWGADGLMHEDWTWKDKGLVLNMSSDKNNVSGTMAVFSIKASAPCHFKTKAGIGIGSSTAEVEEAYRKDINSEESSKEQITVGSVYGGIIFTLKNGKVETIFLGAAAE